ncbi:MAG: hypothetical protein WBE37_31050 [Bryobacteraceae bacterium]
MLAADLRDLRNFGAAEFAGERVARRQQALAGVGERFTWSIDAGPIRWDEPVLIGQPRSNGETGSSTRYRQAPGDQLAA